MSEERRVVVAQDGPVVTITINRERALNALDPQTLDELQAAVRGLSAPGIAGAIVTGAGEKAFAAGADLKAMAAARGEGRGQLVARRGQAVLDELEASPVPVVACVNGFALGGGLELALACHLRYATRSAKVGLPEVTLGLIPGYGGTQRLPRVVGRGLATEMILSGEPIDAAEAHRIGLVNRLFDAKADMLAAATKFLRTVGSRGPLAVRAALAAVGAGLESSLRAGQDVEAALFGAVVASQDAGEGIAAFVEKRAAAFKGT